MSHNTILLIQFRIRTETAQLELTSISRELGSGVAVVAQSALDESFDWFEPERMLCGYRGIILGGSGDFDFDGARTHDDVARAISYQILDRLRPLIGYIFEHDIPTLGICYGHQLLGAFHGVSIIHDEVQRKTRSHCVCVVAATSNNFLCANLPVTFKAQYGHKDVLARVPDGATLIIEGGDACLVSALCYSNNIYSTQFHPELNLEDMQKRVETIPGYLPEGVSVEEIYEESPDAHLILKNFGKLVMTTAIKDI